MTLSSFVRNSTVPPVSKSWILKDGDDISDAFSVSFREELEAAVASSTCLEEKVYAQMFIHVRLLRNHQPRPFYPNGLLPALKKYYNISESEEIDFFGTKLADIKMPEGLAPQWDLSLQLGLSSLTYCQEKQKLNEEEKIARMVLISTNTGAGKTGFEWFPFFLMNCGLPTLPQLCEGHQGPMVLILSQNQLILEGDFLPFLRNRHPYLPPESFAFLDPKKVKVKDNRYKWLMHRDFNVFVLAMTPQCLASELGRHLESEDDNTSIWRALANVRLLILDEVDALGTTLLSTKIDTAMPLKSQCTASPKQYGLTLAYFVETMASRYDHENHLVVGLSATLSRSNVQKATRSYMTLANMPNEDPEEWKKNCVATFIAEPICSVDSQIEDVTMSDLTVKVHDYVVTTLLEKLETSKSVKKAGFQMQLTNFSYAAALGVEVVVHDNAALIKYLKETDEGCALLDEIKEETKSKLNPMAVRAAEIAAEEILAGGQTIIFCHRRAQFAAVQKALVNVFIMKFEKSIKEENVLVICGNKDYAGSKFSGQVALHRFRNPTTYFDRVLVASSNSARGYNLGNATCSVAMGPLMDASNLIQSFGRFLRAGSTVNKKIRLLLTKKLIGSRKTASIMLRQLHDSATINIDNRLWAPISKIVMDLVKQFKKQITDQEISKHSQRDEVIHEVYEAMRKKWAKKTGTSYNEKPREWKFKPREKKKKRKKEESESEEKDEEEDQPKKKQKKMKKRKKISDDDEDKPPKKQKKKLKSNKFIDDEAEGVGDSEEVEEELREEELNSADEEEIDDEQEKSSKLEMEAEEREKEEKEIELEVKRLEESESLKEYENDEACEVEELEACGLLDNDDDDDDDDVPVIKIRSRRKLKRLREPSEEKEKKKKIKNNSDIFNFSQEEENEKDTLVPNQELVTKQKLIVSEKKKLYFWQDPPDQDVGYIFESSSNSEPDSSDKLSDLCAKLAKIQGSKGFVRKFFKF